MRRVWRVYPLVALLAATHFSPMPGSAMALVALLLGLYLLLRNPPRWRVLTPTACFFVLALLFEPALGLLSALLAVPVLPLIGSALRDKAQVSAPTSFPRQKALTPTSKSMLAAMGVMVLVFLLLGDWPLAVAGGVGLVFVMGMITYAWRGLRMPFTEVEQEEIRLIAGDMGRVEVRVRNKTGFPLRVFISSSYGWIHLHGDGLLTLTREADLRLALTPRLSGPSEPELEFFCTDPWGLVRAWQETRPVRLYVIPRARYAEWLARKYLEETASGGRGVVEPFGLAMATVTPKGGVEYYGSRLYQPGDRRKAIDWKHTAKLRRLVVKELGEEVRQVAVIAVNLAAADAEEADRLVYHLISSALTLARAGVPAAIAAYDHQQVLAATALLGARDLVKKALELGRKVVVVAPLERYLQPPDIRQVRTSLRQLEGTTLEAAAKLRSLLELERRAIEEGVREHPARKALRQVSRIVPPVAITVISAWSHDSEALSVTLEELRRLGYGATVVKLEELEGRGGEDRRARAGAQGYQVEDAKSRSGGTLEARY